MKIDRKYILVAARRDVPGESINVKIEVGELMDYLKKEVIKTLALWLGVILLFILTCALVALFWWQGFGGVVG